MSEDFDADALAAAATGDGEIEAASDTTGDHAVAEGAEPSGDVGSESTLREMLMSSEPSKPLSAVDDPWNPEEGGTARIYRGIMKAANISGMPAIGDIIIGCVEAVQNFEGQLPGGDDGDDREQQQQPAEEESIV